MVAARSFPLELLYWGGGTEAQLDSRPHFHSFFQLEICRVGRMNGTNGGENLSLAAGDYWLIPPETPHRFHDCGEPVVFYSIKFQADLPGRSMIRGGDPVADYQVRAIGRLLDAAGGANQLTSLTATLIEQHLWCLLHSPGTDRPGRDGVASPFLLRQKERISLLGALANVSRLAEEEGMSLSRFKSRFRREAGGRSDIKNFIAEVLIRNAVGHLVYSPRNLTEIARVMNFSTIYAFSRFFKHRVGMSPLEYRVRHRG